MATTSTKTRIDLEPIPKRELLDYRAELKYEIFRQLRRRFNELRVVTGFDQNALAKRLDVDKSLVSRRLKGENDMRLETFSDLARGLDCRIDVTLTPLSTTLAELTQTPFKVVASTVWAGVQDYSQSRTQPKASTPRDSTFGSDENQVNAG